VSSQARVAVAGSASGAIDGVKTETDGDGSWAKRAGEHKSETARKSVRNVFILRKLSTDQEVVKRSAKSTYFKL
jgi:hypothetical protein